MWQHINEKTKETLREMETYDTAFEGKVITDIVRVLPEGAHYLRVIVCQFVIQIHSSSHRIKIFK